MQRVISGQETCALHPVTSEPPEVPDSGTHAAGAGGAPVTVALLKLRGALGGSAEFAREIQVFVKLGLHPHLATLLGVTTHPDGSMCMLVEYALRGSKSSILNPEFQPQNPQNP